MDQTVNGIRFKQLEEFLWEIPKQGGMLVPGRLYISRDMLQSASAGEEFKQVMNVAHLPGIIGYSLAMPDIHWGYGFPIGGVAATDVNTGVISPGGVGYDINCGVRLCATALAFDEIKTKLEMLIKNLFECIPTGVGAKGAIKKLSVADLKKVAEKGVTWAVENGFGGQTDIEYTEENGRLNNADFSCVSSRAIERGADQLGTLGSGNHFLEVGVVSEIFDEQKAAVIGLRKNQVVILIHTGSRGFGYQICDDYLKTLVKANQKYGINLPDKQLACAPLNSDEGKNYLAAMAAAANFAWNNRQIIMSLAMSAFLKTFKINPEDLRFRLVYDVSHNIAKFEDHVFDGTKQTVCVHRKGATRAFAPGSRQIPSQYRNIGQPVLIPGDMGRYSFVCAGTEKAMTQTFGSSCHGAGRVLSRTKAAKAGEGRNLIKELREHGILVQARGNSTVAEEMPMAYKDVRDVVDVMHNAGITTRIAKLRPVGVIKG